MLICLLLTSYCLRFSVCHGLKEQFRRQSSSSWHARSFSIRYSSLVANTLAWAMNLICHNARSHRTRKSRITIRELRAWARSIFLLPTYIHRDALSIRLMSLSHAWTAFLSQISIDVQSMVRLLTQRDAH